MLHRLDDTIAAVATAPGGAARGVVRVAGIEAVRSVTACFTASDGAASAGDILALLRVPTALEGNLSLLGFHQPVPCSLLVWPTQRSYTRSPLVEIHTLGSPPLLSAVLRTICSHGARLAEPGEFTLRAFLNGRIDLAQAEAVLGVIDAAGKRQLDVALKQLSGGLSTPLHQLRESLLDLLSELEAGLDFADEEIELISGEEIGVRLTKARSAIERLAAQMQDRGESAVAPRVVLCGSPNVGKSSLFNALVSAYGAGRASQPGAPVSPEPGTTRDYLTARITLGDLTVELIDTAGVEPAAGQPAAVAHAQTMTQEQGQQADLIITCVDASRVLSAEDERLLAATNVTSGARSESSAPQRLILLTKCDLPRRAYLPSAIESSAVTRNGLAPLCDSVRAALSRGEREGQRLDVVSSTAARCRESLTAAAARLASAAQFADSGSGEELIAAELRAALAELGQVTGEVYTDDILDRIFSRFCIGK